MNGQEIHGLQQISGSPEVTITLPTHRTTPKNRPHPTRGKNLVKRDTNSFA